MDLTGLEQDLYRRLNFNTTPETTTQTRLRAFLNETQQEVLREPGLEGLLYDTIPVASVASQAVYAVPPTIQRIRAVLDTTNRRPLLPASRAWWHQTYPSPTALTGVPSVWVDLGQVAVATQPTAAAELFAISTAAGDTATIYVEGYRTGGYPMSKSVAMTGVTGVSLSTAITDWIEVTKCYLSAAAVGVVTLRMTSGLGTVVTTIPIGRTFSRYRAIALAICPAAVLSYTVEVLREVPLMAIATDEPVLPPMFHNVLSAGARMKEYEKQEDLPRWQLAAGEYSKALRGLKFFLANQGEGAASLRGPSAGSRSSSLGAWYPAGT